MSSPAPGTRDQAVPRAATLLSAAGTRRAGFTLFEVLAAALILVIVGTITIGSMNANLARMTDARLRLEAARIADSAMADLEATLFDGTAPKPFSDENEIDGYRVKISVVPFGTLFDMDQAEADAESKSPSLFGTIVQEFPGLPQHLRSMRVEVSWGDGAVPDSVVRTTIGFDHAGALEQIEERANGGDTTSDEGATE